MKRKRVVITGMGVISPVGLDIPTMWKKLVAGKSGIRPITLFDTDGFDVCIAGEAWGFNPYKYMKAKEVRRTDRFSQFAIAALGQVMPGRNSAVAVGAETAIGEKGEAEDYRALQAVPVERH